MGKRTGQKSLTIKDREEIKSLIRKCEGLRYDKEETLMYLEDMGHNIGHTTLYKLKKELREELGSRLEEIGRYELVYEHDLALQMLKSLQQIMWKMMNDPKTTASERVKVSTELRSLIHDIVDHYGSSEIVEKVFKFFEEKYGKKD